ncbi:YidC/Oxa1 family membrane protein insertase [Streptococcus pluranimalium]|uniref:YidC/Oxa1 family membrane protein insertase n=1 Tax=Streptococcus hyovaginalis TaxID=149015 RepID=UPI002A90D21F|nr:YidC/Oxa1 family membrane protein insertase [Streptococcus hyovaginalis]MDY5973548.1 YidC/Oxa1 family membrane protein insertase [Streptococcus hyovaginalis]
MKKKIRTLVMLGMALVVLTACGTSQVTETSTGFWNRLIYLFAEIIRYLGFGGSIGLGIVLFTLLIRLILMPLYHMQLKSSQKMQELQPELRELQRRYAGPDNRLKLAEESQALYKKYDINPYASFIPLFVQLPILMALYQALSRVSFLKEGHFLWVNLAERDPYFILPILAALFTFLSTWLTNKAAKESNITLTLMTYVMPILILVMGVNLASGIALYWTVSNAFQVVQILLLNNPFKIIAERKRLEDEERERQARIRRAKKKARRK